MARKRGIKWEYIVASLIFYLGMRYYTIPKFMHDMEHNSQVAMQQNMQNYQNALAKQKADEQARLDAVAKPVYVDKPHQGYTIRKAEIRTCAMAQCTVVGYLPKETMVKWDKVENGFVNYESAYYVKLVDVKQLF